MIGHIATVAVYVEDQTEALRFWTQTVGFTVHRNIPMGPDGSWIEVGPKDAESRLVLYPRDLMKNWAERKPSIVFHCDDVQAAYKQLSARGVRFGEEPKETEWGLFTWFEDPDGNQFVLRSNG